jgi:hypothetical protein
MKVLKKGRGQKGWSIEATCTGAGNGGGGCGALLLVEQDDLFKTFITSFCEPPDVCVSFVCSECGVMTDIEDSVPIYVARSLPDKGDWSAKRKGRI